IQQRAKKIEISAPEDEVLWALLYASPRCATFTQGNGDRGSSGGHWRRQPVTGGREGPFLVENLPSFCDRVLDVHRALVIIRMIPALSSQARHRGRCRRSSAFSRRF